MHSGDSGRKEQGGKEWGTEAAPHTNCRKWSWPVLRGARTTPLTLLARSCDQAVGSLASPDVVSFCTINVGDLINFLLIAFCTEVLCHTLGGNSSKLTQLFAHMGHQWPVVPSSKRAGGGDATV